MSSHRLPNTDYNMAERRTTSWVRHTSCYDWEWRVEHHRSQVLWRGQLRVRSAELCWRDCQIILELKVIRNFIRNNTLRERLELTSFKTRHLCCTTQSCSLCLARQVVCVYVLPLYALFYLKASLELVNHTIPLLRIAGKESPFLICLTTLTMSCSTLSSTIPDPVSSF